MFMIALLGYLRYEIIGAPGYLDLYKANVREQRDSVCAKMHIWSLVAM